ncbi:hypothetical protein [Roseivirga sp. E12]|uniref:hypothetical protein n=1 Tax=Roseivirga sp. E12 TaxID=2819237 RepID=UPI001ABCD35F|nr:hypothetical protein [Roseivirga sp. E12]MBO3697720.1 hypothetical protein [Roseivirga sp. E12]
MSSPKATYQIEDTFKITGRGIVFAGKIMEGIVNLSDIIEFEFNGELIRRRITGIEGIRSTPEKPNIGILIECPDDNEINVLREWNPNFTIAKIFDKE